MNRRFTVVPLVAAAVFGLVACNNSTVGSPSATPATGGTQPGGPTSDGSSTGTTALQPCDLAGADVISQLQLTTDGPKTGDSARSCDYSKAVDANGQNGYTLSIDIRDSQGIKDVNAAGYTVTTDNIGSHQGKRLQSTNSGDCIVALGVSNSSRVDVTVNAGTDANQACQAANALAKSVEPKLPAGGN